MRVRLAKTLVHLTEQADVMVLDTQIHWEQLTENLITGGWRQLTELGPGVALRSICRHINEDVASRSFRNIEV